MFEKEKKSTAIVTLIASFVIILLIAPWLSFWCSYFVGWISKMLIGKYIVAGFALVNIDLPLDKIPLLAGCLGWIASFFMRVNNKNS